MRHRECGCLGYGRMPCERLIDFKRRDFLAAAVDQIVLAAVQREEAIPVNAADISRPKPAVDESTRD